MKLAKLKNINLFDIVACHNFSTIITPYYPEICNKQKLFRALLFNIGNYSPKVIDI